MKPIHEIRLISPTEIEADGKRYACVIGKGGVTDDKSEGDHMTPKGTFPVRCCYYRADRVELPSITLPTRVLTRDDGWCDDPSHVLYNRKVDLPFSGSHEQLWRVDQCYDIIVPLGYNDMPAIPGKGSAIFLHCMHDSGRATEGCIAMKKEDLLEILPRLNEATRIVIG